MFRLTTLAEWLSRGETLWQKQESALLNRRKEFACALASSGQVQIGATR